jgi:quinohemoprotein ethanol dehydrogenase
MRFTALAAAVAALALAGCAKDGTSQPEAGVGTEAEWTAVGGSADEAGYSRLEELTPASVDRLGLAWSLDLPGEVSL